MLTYAMHKLFCLSLQGAHPLSCFGTFLVAEWTHMSDSNDITTICMHPGMAMTSLLCACILAWQLYHYYVHASWHGSYEVQWAACTFSEFVKFA
jgi:hypothetical protein